MIVSSFMVMRADTATFRENKSITIGRGLFFEDVIGFTNPEFTSPFEIFTGLCFIPQARRVGNPPIVAGLSNFWVDRDGMVVIGDGAIILALAFCVF